MAPQCCGSGECSAKPKLRFQYGKKKNGQWYWHIRARNSEIIAQGEGYKRVAGVKKVLRILGDNGLFLAEEEI
jgi:uncharacterized protein YegP (UPF0339 family)